MNFLVGFGGLYLERVHNEFIISRGLSFLHCDFYLRDFPQQLVRTNTITATKKVRSSYQIIEGIGLLGYLLEAKIG